MTGLHPDETLAIITLDRFGRSTQKVLELTVELRPRNIGLRILNLGGGDVNFKTPKNTTDSNFGGQHPTFTDSRIRTVSKLIQTGELK